MARVGTMCRGHPTSTHWDEPPPPPTLAEILPGNIAASILDNAVQSGNTALVKALTGKKTATSGTHNIVAGPPQPLMHKKAEPGFKDPLQAAKQRLRDERRGRKSSSPLPKGGLRSTAAAPKAVVPQALPPTPIALLFPGQGSQYVKMLSDLKENPKVKEYVAIANRVLGYDLLKKCLEGPEDDLAETSVCQPAMYLAGVAGIEKLKVTRPEAVERPGAVAGLSLGEYTALCVAEVFTFEEGFELVKLRGEAMSNAAKSKPQTMLSVAGLEQPVLDDLCKQCAKDGEVCQIANVLFPKGFSCAGTQKGIEDLKVKAEGAGALQAKMLKTSGGFHTDLMKPAQQQLEVALKKLLPKMKPPRCDVYMNVTGAKLKAGTPPAEIYPLLAKQLCNPVLWEPTIRVMIKDGLTEFYEVGPMKQLKAMMKRIDPTMWGNTVNIDV